MNIFALDLDPAAAARLHCDRHVVKMILETAQMLSTVITAAGAQAPGLYRPTHLRHPCTVWAGLTGANFRWLVALGLALGREHALRYAPKREHKSLAVIRACSAELSAIPAGNMTPFAQAMPERYRAPDPVCAYRDYYRYEKAHIATWREPRERPAWMG